MHVSALIPAGDIAHLKAHPEKFAYGAAGSLSHLAPLLFLLANGVSALEVPYKGGGPVLVDLVAVRVQFAMTGRTPVMPMLKDTRIKAPAFAALK